MKRLLLLSLLLLSSCTLLEVVGEIGEVIEPSKSRCSKGSCLDCHEVSNIEQYVI